MTGLSPMLYLNFMNQQKISNENTIGCLPYKKIIIFKGYFRDNIPNPIRLIDLFYKEKPSQDLVMMTRSDYLKK